MQILVTGGTGFIGSHTVVSLLNQNDDVVIIDNLMKSHPSVIDAIHEITGKKPIFYTCDIRDQAMLEHVFSRHTFDAVIHFAGLKAVGESVEQPLLYYQNNVEGSITLFRVMQKYNCQTIVFSSSATVYGLDNISPLKETMPTEPINPYGQTKAMIETILKDLHHADAWRVALLRYFNPIGAHPSGLIGENPKDTPNNVMPLIVQVARKQRPSFMVFGNNYDTPDGTGIRDYVHVMDLAEAHIKALNYIQSQNACCEVLNIGTGQGYSVLELIKTFASVNQVQVPYTIGKRRPGDVAICYADSQKAFNLLHWQPKHNLKSMVKDSYHYDPKA